MVGTLDAYSTRQVETNSVSVLQWSAVVRLCQWCDGETWSPVNLSLFERSLVVGVCCWCEGET